MIVLESAAYSFQPKNREEIYRDLKISRQQAAEGKCQEMGQSPAISYNLLGKGNIFDVDWLKGSLWQQLFRGKRWLPVTALETPVAGKVLPYTHLTKRSDKAGTGSYKVCVRQFRKPRKTHSVIPDVYWQFLYP